VRLLAASVFALVTLPAAAQSFNQQEQAEIRAIVRDYLVRNPDVLKEALSALETRVSDERWREITRDRRDFSIGPADAPIVIVEYFDYNCSYCHAAFDWVSGIVRDRRDVRLILKELPVLGPSSMEAARASLAAMPQGRYWEFHRAMITYQGELSSEAVDSLARRAGVDVARMRRAMESPAITSQLETLREQAVEYQFQGTPGFVINGETIPGFDRGALEARVREAAREARTRQQAQR
jgi:protein-disulfide isomerase